MGRREHRQAAAALGCVVAAFAAIYLRRLATGFSNVDDFLYAQQTRTYVAGLRDGGLRGFVDSWEVYGQNSPLVPGLAMPIHLLGEHPNSLVLVQLASLLAVAVACAALLAQLGARAEQRWMLAAVVACLPPVLGYAAMLHFAVAASACTVGALAAYLASDRLRRWRPTLAFGVLLGLLALSRVVAPVYLAALGVVVVVDMLSDRQDWGLRLRTGLVAATAVLLIAGPWWLVNGERAYDWVRKGYDADSGFAERRSPLELLWGRLEHTAGEIGLILAIALTILLVRAVVGAIRRRDRPTLLSAGVLLVGMLGLATSSNDGTAFALPMVVIAACIAAADLRLRTRTILVTGAALVGAVALLPTPGNELHPLWLGGTPGEAQAQQALGCDCRVFDTDALNRDVMGQLDGRVLVIRDDALLNANSMQFFVEPGVGLRTLDYGLEELPPDVLEGIDTVIAGSSEAPYHGRIDLGAVDDDLREAGFEPAWRRPLSPSNEVVVWRR